MTISGLSTATLQSLLGNLNSGSAGSSSDQATNLLNSLKAASQPSPSSVSAGQSPAYVLSDSQKQSKNQLLSYSNLGTLINKTNSSLNEVITSTGQAPAVDGLGNPLLGSVAVTVNNLATAQTLDSGSYPTSDKAVMGTGALSLSVGSGASISINVTDGSLSGVATAINDAAAGISAKVVANNDGSFKLQITGNNTGASNGFSLSGISGLVFNPTTNGGDLQATILAADASYTVGGVTKTSPSNDQVSVAPGIVTSFSQTGTHNVTSPLGQSTASSNAQTLVSEINALIKADPNAGQSSASSSTNTTLTKILDTIAGQSFSVGTGSHSLSDLGISVGSDGTLAVDQTKLTAAYQSSPTIFNSVINQASKAVETTLSGAHGVSSQVKSSVQTLVAQMVHLPSLADILAGNSTSSSSSSNSSLTSQLLSGFSA
jgi:flagellar hook-associated protein 2